MRSRQNQIVWEYFNVLDIVSIVFLIGYIPFKYRNSFTRKGFQRLSVQNATLQFRQQNAERTPKDEDEARRILIPTIRVGVREGYFGFW